MLRCVRQSLREGIGVLNFLFYLFIYLFYFFFFFGGGGVDSCFKLGQSAYSNYVK